MKKNYTVNTEQILSYTEKNSFGNLVVEKKGIKK